MSERISKPKVIILNSGQQDTAHSQRTLTLKAIKSVSVNHFLHIQIDKKKKRQRLQNTRIPLVANNTGMIELTTITHTRGSNSLALYSKHMGSFFLNLTIRIQSSQLVVHALPANSAQTQQLSGKQALKPQCFHRCDAAKHSALQKTAH